MTTTANPSAFEAWNGDSGRRWVASADRHDRVLAPAADALLDAADPHPGSRVLDIGCGCGVTTLAAGRATGAAGSATGLVHRFEPDTVDLVIHVDPETTG